MTDAIVRSTPSRRAVFTGAGALLAGAALSAAPTLPAALNPDAELIRLLNEFNDLERDWAAQLMAGVEFESTDDHPRYARQDEIAQFVEENPPQTLEGFRAVAYATVLWAPDLWDQADMTLGSNLGALTGALLRGLLGGVKP